MTLHVRPEPLPVLMVTGLAKEMRLAEGPGLVAIASGGDTGRLRRRLAERTVPGCRAVLSFGIAGGLDPSLSAGDVVVATGIIADGAALAGPSGARRSARGVALGRRHPHQARRHRRRRCAAADAVGQGGDAARDRRRGGRHGIACRLRVRGAARPDVRGAPDHLRSGDAARCRRWSRTR